MNVDPRCGWVRASNAHSHSCCVEDKGMSGGGWMSRTLARL